MEESERVFTDLIRSFGKRHNELTRLIRAQEKAAVSQAEEAMKQLEQKISQLRRRNFELERLSHTEDPVHFLQVTEL